MQFFLGNIAFCKTTPVRSEPLDKSPPFQRAVNVGISKEKVHYVENSVLPSWWAKLHTDGFACQGVGVGRRRPRRPNAYFHRLHVFQGNAYICCPLKRSRFAKWLISVKGWFRRMQYFLGKAASAKLSIAGMWHVRKSAPFEMAQM